jgi:hypothetical protein
LSSHVYRKKPVVIEAVQFTGPDTVDDVLAFLGAPREDGEEIEDFAVITICTLEGDLTASPGDWIIRGVQGEFYPCKPDIFEATYEAAVVDE